MNLQTFFCLSKLAGCRHLFFCHGWLVVFTLSCAALALPGCSNPAATGPEGDSAKPKLPKMKFHRPKTAELAVKRLRELHTAIDSDLDMPQPTSFSVLEIIHGEGKSAHSHFYLESRYKPEDEDHHHEGMKTSKKVHQVQIDALTEMKDIVSWLPNIAAGANLAEAKWNEVNSESKSMEDLFEKQITPAGSLDLKRQAYRKNAKTIQDCIARLETAIESS